MTILFFLFVKKQLEKELLGTFGTNWFTNLGTFVQAIKSPWKIHLK